MERSRLETAATVAIIAAALSIVVGQLLRLGWLSSDDAPAPRLNDGDPELILESEWQQLLDSGVMIGDPAAEVVVVEFVDLECPFCRRSHQAIWQVKDTLDLNVAYVFVHYPIDSHRFARPAARASECARKQDRFEPYIRTVFAKQDSLGLKPWVSYAMEADVRDLGAFEDCVSESSPLPMVDRGLEMGSRIGVSATPTVLINRWRLPRAPHENVGEIIDKIVHDQPPFHE